MSDGKILTAIASVCQSFGACLRRISLNADFNASFHGLEYLGFVDSFAKISSHY